MKRRANAGRPLMPPACLKYDYASIRLDAARFGAGGVVGWPEVEATAVKMEAWPVRCGAERRVSRAPDSIGGQ